MSPWQEPGLTARQRALKVCALFGYGDDVERLCKVLTEAIDAAVKDALAPLPEVERLKACILDLEKLIRVAVEPD